MNNKLILKYPRTFLLLLYAVLGVVLYFRVMAESGFLFDDFEYIVGNAIIYDIQTLLSNFSDPRQIGYLTFALNYLINGNSPAGYHVVNVLIHIANATLVFFLASNLLTFAGGKREQADFGLSFLFPATVGLIFLVHPLETQAVSYVTQRFTSLAAFFYLAAVVLYLEARRNMDTHTSGTASLVEYWAALACALFAMKVKEIAFTLPVAIVALELLLIGKPEDRKRSIYLVVPFVATMVIIPLSIIGPEWGIIDKSVGIAETTRVLKIEDLTTRSPLEYFATQTRVLVIYLRLLFFPYPQSVIYDLVASKSLFELWVLLSLGLHVSLLAGAVYSWKRSLTASETRAPFLKLIALGIGWFYLTASVESSVLPIKDLVFEHRAYLPSVGMITAALSALLLVIQDRPVRNSLSGTVVAGTLVIAVVLGVVTFMRNMVWLNEVAFWGDVVEKTPNKAIGYNNRGHAFLNQGRFEEALQDVNKTVNFFENTIGQKLSWESSDYTSENMAKTYTTRSKIYAALGFPEKADADRQTARKLMFSPMIRLADQRQAAENYSDRHEYRQAIDIYTEILDWFPDDLDAWVGRGNANSDLGDYAAALRDLSEAIRRHPESPLGYYNRAIVYSRTGKGKQAQPDMQHACSMGFPPACQALQQSGH